MARLSQFFRMRSVLVPCFFFASAGYMMYLVYAQYQTQEKLQKSFLQRNLQESEKKALALGYFLSERRYDLSHLAEAHDFTMYYKNKALGMSVEYGLGASINSAQEMLGRFREKRQMDGQPIFSRLVYAEFTGKILFESRDKKVFPRSKQPVSRNLYRASNHVEFSCEKIGGSDYLIMSFPFMFNERYQGRISGWIPVERIRRHFVENRDKDDSWLSIITFGNRYLVEKSEESSLPRLPLLSNAGRHTTTGIHSNTGSVPAETQNGFQAFIVSIPSSPLSLVSFLRRDNEGAVRTRGLFYILTGISLALLTGGIAFYRVSVRSAVLETRLEETQLREKIVEEKNSNLRKLRAALEQSSCSVVITDINGSIEYVNAHFSHLTGYSAEEAIGQNPRLLQSGEESLEKYQDLWETVLQGKIWSGEFINRKKNGDLYWEQSNIAPVMDEFGEITCLIAIKDDITERKKSEIELCTAKEAAESANRAKSTFLANMSHEIRTPMNGIIGMTDLCLSTDLDEQQRAYLAAVRISAENLLAIINDILDFSKIEADKIAFDTSPFCLRTTVGQALQTLAPRAMEKNLEILFVPAADTPDTLIGDPGRLKQVLVNLVGNAVKFSENGKVLVSVSAVAEHSNQCILSFSVKDSGIGIPLDYQGSIFDPFEQGDLSTTKIYGGTGLGLTISRKLVELMGGTFQVDSEEGKGSSFTFTARFILDRSPTQASTEYLQNKKALIVDDSAINRRVLADYLAQWGMVSSQAENFAEALSYLQQSHQNCQLPDVILVDEQMPGDDGWQLLHNIRGNADFDSVRCILMPNLGVSGDTMKCKELRIDGYLQKPIVHGELHERLSTLLSGASGEKPSVSSLKDDSHKRKRLSILIAEDVIINQEVLQAILDDCGHTLTIVDNGADAVTHWENNRADVDLILMDVQMPRMDGLEATRKIREQEMTLGSHIPIVAMTAYAMKDDREKCLDAGMDTYLSKPFRPVELLSLLDRYSTPGRTMQESTTNSATTKSTSLHGSNTDTAVVFNHPALLARIGDREDMVAPLVTSFVSLTEKTLPELENMIAALDLELLRKLTHTLTGAAANIGADRMKNILTEITADTQTGNVEVLKNRPIILQKEFEQFKSATVAHTNGGKGYHVGHNYNSLCR